MDVVTGLPWILVSLFVMGAGIGMALVSSTNLSFTYISEGQDGQLSGLTNTFRQAGSSAGVAILNAVFMAFIVIAPGSVITEADLIPGFRHAFFVAILISLIAFVIAMGLKDREPSEQRRRQRNGDRCSIGYFCTMEKLSHSFLMEKRS